MNTPSTGTTHRSHLLVSVVLLTIVTLLAFANAWHDNLVFDDRAFVGPDRLAELPQFHEAFTRDVWGNAHAGKGLYRPLLLISLEVETRLFGEWTPGYHMVNVLFHLAASLLLLGFVRFLLARGGRPDRLSELAALLAALVFAVHPVHTEVINSVFNGSSIYVSLFAIAGLWWLLHYLESKPAKAWFGLGVAYTIGILFKESALVLPGIAVALVVLLTPGSARERMQRFLPVFWLLLPLAAYFALRAAALTTGGEAIDEDLVVMLDNTRLPGQETLASALLVAGMGLKMLLWPHPLQIFYGYATPLMSVVLIGGQLVLAALAVYRFAKGRPALAAGLAFYYVAMMPATRLVSMDGSSPHMAERYLYFPSIGLAITLAFVFVALLRRFGVRPVTAVMLPLLLFLSILCWERNYEWSSEQTLFETEYALGNHGISTVRVLISTHMRAGRSDRVVEICDENESFLDEFSVLAGTCAMAYQKQGRSDDAIRWLETTLDHDGTWLKSRIALAKIQLQQGNRQEGADHFAYIVNRVEKPAQKEFFKGQLYVHVYPGSRKYLELALSHFENAARLDPEMESAVEWIEFVSEILDPSGDSKPEAPEIEEKG
jgi:tetratricopeptide (TPR) repeat protein